MSINTSSERMLGNSLLIERSIWVLAALELAKLPVVVIEVEKLGLTITRSAMLLNIAQSRLSKIIKKHKINWRGRREYITKRG